MNNYLLIWVLTLGIVLIRAYWIFEEVTQYKDRASWQTVKNNTIEAFILIAQIISAIYFPMPIGSLLVTIGVIMYIIGMMLAIWAKITMRQSWGIPAIHNINKQNTLVKTGPYRFSRHPIYVAFTLIYVGYAIAIRSWLIVLRIPLFIYFYKSSIAEEKDLERHFGKEYSTYKKRVPRFLFV